VDTFLEAVVGAVFVFVLGRFLKYRLTVLGYLGAGALAALGAWILRRVVFGSDPLTLVL
jgi:hypothetical protein